MTRPQDPIATAGYRVQSGAIPGFERFSNLPMLMGVLRQLDGEIARKHAEIADMERQRAFVWAKFEACCAPPVAHPREGEIQTCR